MTASDWSCPDADPHGFVAFELIRKRASGGTLEQFLADFPAPALLVDCATGDEQSSALDGFNPATDSGVQLLTISIKSAAILRYLGRVAFVAKRPGNPYAHLISVGRSATNDITMAVDSVSKVHGYFVREGDGWSFTDHGSTNGTTLEGNPLEPGGKYPLHDGAVLKLGVETMLQYLSPESLYRKALG